MSIERMLDNLPVLCTADRLTYVSVTWNENRSKQTSHFSD